jgi:uncharacterized protein YqgV (UPF0045/DUF77 family)
MAKRKYAAEASKTIFRMEPSFELNGFVINEGDIVKVIGEYGCRFKVRGFTTNIETGAQWVDTFEMIRGVPSAFRAFKLERIKRVPKRGKRAKRVV